MGNISWKAYLGETLTEYVARLYGLGFEKPEIRRIVFMHIPFSSVMRERAEIGIRARLGEMKTEKQAMGGGIEAYV